LRFGKLDYLHEWTANLKDWFTWLPDGTAIRGEHLARLGRHDEALDVFIELAARGLPLFSDGLSYVIDRLRFYNTLGEKEFKADRLAQAKQLLENLQRFVPYVDFRKPILTYTGIDPSHPDGEALGDFLPATGGLEVNSILT
jgi:hypothetical protein